jgi:GrpB-like predicted nucleotidyltransferase (UPF0157 family)
MPLKRPPSGKVKLIKTPQPIIRLVGELRLRGADWEMPEFASLFGRLGTIVRDDGVLTRHLRYYGEIGDRTEVRFFGIEVESITQVPEGMVALELGGDTITVLEPGCTGPVVVIWRGDLKWDWLDNSQPGFPVGEFTARIPAGWASQPDTPPVKFILSANAYFERSKAADNGVCLVVYDPTWPAKYDEMADWLRKTVPPGIALRIEHYGSTAIPDMPAKPIIDILLEIPLFAEARRSMIPVFNKPEWEYWWYDEHMVFILRKEFMGTRTHHLHAAPPGHRVWEGIVFRDYLRTRPDEAARYAALKHGLAGSYTTDREAYTNSKEEFVRDIIKKARGPEFS